MSEFVGGRLRVARRFHGLSQTDLGREVAAAPTTISMIEANLKRPSDLLVDAISAVLSFDQEYFFAPLEDEYKDSECNFRRRRSTPVGLRRRVLSYGTLLSEIVKYLETVLTLPAVRVPTIRVSSAEGIERAAERTRTDWGLGTDAPLTHVVRALENAGVVVTRIWADTEKVDAFSRPSLRSTVALIEDKGSPSRSIFDAAHELGHLIMHRGLAADEDSELEPQADRFASAFILPRRAFAREFRVGTRLDWPLLFELKRRWRCSVAAIVRRAYDLELMNAAHYRQAHRYIRLKGWHKGEPFEPQPEYPELLSTAFDALKTAIGEDTYDVGRRLRLRPEVMAQVTGLPVRRPSEKMAGVTSIDGFRGRQRDS